VTKRVVAALLALTAAILIAAVVPLGLLSIEHARDAFTNGTGRTASTIAALAETRLNGDASDPALSSAMLSAAREHDEMLLLNRQGQVVVSQGTLEDNNWRQLVAPAAQQDVAQTQLTSGVAIAVETVWGDGKLSGTPIGTVVLERPTTSLHQNLQHLLLYMIGLSVAALAAAVLIAVYLARWVSRPLAQLDSAARKIADGDLSVRAKTSYGPPDLRRTAATFNMMAGRLEALVHGHRAMLADASHQLRTPLTALRLRLDLLAVDAPPATGAELAGAQEEIARLSRLVDGLLATARAEAVTEQLEQIDVASVVDERVDAWHPVGSAHGVKLLAEPPVADAPLVALAAGHLEQVLDNLLDNAIEAIEESGADGGSVRVSVEKSENGVRLTVADDGPGMTPAERSRAFLRFTTGSQNGTGLGLAIVHRLVTSNGGMIRLADTPGGGLTVEIDLAGADES
jgi:signal transduction histidine kinase